MYPRAYCYHLWYIYMLILLYALTPLIICIVRAGKEYVDYILIIWMIFSVIYPFLNFWCPRFCLKDYEEIKVLGGNFGYYILGYRLHKFKGFSNSFWILLFCIGWIGTVILSIGYQNYSGNYNDFFMKFLSPGIVMMAISFFMLIKNLLEGGKNMQIVSKLSRLSLGIYFIHYMIRDVIQFFLEKGYINEWLYLMISPLITIVLSAFIIDLVSKNKVLGFLFAGISENKVNATYRQGGKQ